MNFIYFLFKTFLFPKKFSITTKTNLFLRKMLQFHKIFSILISSFARPVITYTKQYELQRKTFSHYGLRRFFIFMGNKYNSFEILLIRGRTRLSSAEIEKNKVLTDELAYEY